MNKILHGASLVQAAITLRRIGIAQILIKEYHLEINSTYINAFFHMGAPELEMMDLITEFNIDIKLILFIMF